MEGREPLSLAEEIHQRRPFSSIQDEALISIFVTWDLLSRNLTRVLRKQGLSLPQYNVLRILRGAGPDGLPLMTIAQRMVVRYPNITRLTDRLETIGWIRRERSTRDRRVVRAFVTQEGLELLDALQEDVASTTQQVMRGAGEEDLGRLVAILEAVRRPLRAESPARAAARIDVRPAESGIR